MVPITWDKIGMKNLPKRSFFSTSTKTVPINTNSAEAFEYIQLPVQSMAVDWVEYLCKNKGIEDQSLDNGILMGVNGTVRCVMVTQDT